jgi:hypothetical protein
LSAYECQGLYGNVKGRVLCTDKPLQGNEMRKIDQIATVFPADIAERVYNLVSNAEFKYGWRSSMSTGYGHWNKDYGRGGSENGIDISANLKDYPALDEAWRYLKSMYWPAADLVRCYVNVHTFGVEGYPHTDSSRIDDKTVVVYVNKGWRREWGGETVVYDGNKIACAELPAFNRGIVFYGDQYHQARSVTRICPEARMTLMFKFSEVRDETRNAIQTFLRNSGAYAIEHDKSKLAYHLLNTYDDLKARGHDQAICSAGGMHSIFGTNWFKSSTVTLANSAVIENIVGSRALQLIHFFNQLNRPDTLEAALKNKSLDVVSNTGVKITLNQETFDALCYIEAANLADQKFLKNYPHLQAMWASSKVKYN